MQFFWLSAAAVITAFLPFSVSIELNPDDEGENVFDSILKMQTHILQAPSRALAPAM